MEKKLQSDADTLRQMCFGIWPVMCGTQSILHALFVFHRHIILCAPLFLQLLFLYTALYSFSDVVLCVLCVRGGFFSSCFIVLLRLVLFLVLFARTLICFLAMSRRMRVLVG